jgi:purine-binding chemotaxis protein CheW
MGSSEGARQEISTTESELEPVIDSRVMEAPVDLRAPAEASRDEGAENAGPRQKNMDAAMHILVFKVAGHEYAVEVGLVQEICRPTEILHLAGVGDHIVGVIRQRGRIVPIVDLRNYWGLPTDPATVETCVIVARLPVGLVGLLVDAVSDLMRLDASAFEVPSYVAAELERPDFLGVAHLGDRLLVLLDPRQLLIPTLPEQVAGSDLAVTDDGWGEVAALLGEELDGQTAARDVEPEPRRSEIHNLVVFELSGELYGIAIGDVTEIRRPMPIQPLPRVPQHVLGLINVRGAVIPVVDLRRRFNLPILPERAGTRLMVLKGPGYPVAIWADEVHGVARLSRADLQPAPAGVARIDAEYYEQVTTFNERLLIELNVVKLLVDTAARAEEIYA